MNTANEPGSHGPTDLLAAEYVLGVLDSDERLDVERRMAGDKRLAQAIDAWNHRLAPLADDIAPVEPPKALWVRIRNTTEAMATTSKPQPSSPGRRTTRLWDNIIAWRWVGGGALAVAACCLLILFTTSRILQPQTQPAGYMVSTITGDSGASGYVATINLPDAQIVVIPIAKNEAPHRVPQLWMIAPGEKPLSLGLLQPHRSTTISVPPAVIAKMGPQDVLAISLEPPGGSPTGQPTGPVVAKGGLAGA